MTSLTVASFWFNAILDALEQQGVDRTKLTAGLRGIVDGRMPETARIELSPSRVVWSRARELSADPLLGIKVGVSLPIQAVNVIAVVSAHSPTFREAIRYLLRYQALLSESGQFTALPLPDGLRVSYKPNPDIIAMDILQTDAIIACLIASGPRPEVVHLAARRRADPAPYSEILKCPVRLGAEHAAADYDARSLNTIRPGGDIALRDINIAYAETLLSALRKMDALCQRVRAAIGALGPQIANVETVAAEVGCSSRTLQRRLGSAGTSFSELFDAYRMEKALIMLSDSGASIGQISDILGYSEVSTFSRAVSQWWGHSPRALRQGD